MSRKCKNCGRDISHKHPNAKFHSTKCKDKYWNYIRGDIRVNKVPTLDDYDSLPDYDPHPFSSEGLGQWEN